MVGKLVLWAADKVATYVLTRPTIADKIYKASHKNKTVPAGAPVDFHVAGKKGQILWASTKVYFSFTGQKLFATDSARVRGSGTRILLTIVGDKVLDASNLGGELGNGVSTSVFAANMDGKNVLYPRIKPDQKIYYLVKFDEDCEWFAALHGSIPATEAPTANEEIR